jgi:hypothetical protein
LDSASNLAKPCPFTSLVGLISRSNSIILAIHLPLLPSMSGCMRMSFIEVEGTYAVIFECKTLDSESFEGFHKGIGLLLHDLVLEIYISQCFAKEANRLIFPLVIFL